ncbi:hypothetical protein thsps21_50550 [Pseudomonas sp. No.21]|jgi:hypothetical protein|nr:hypothetical protein TUM20249_43290 [Pseudomonas tohonis]
MGRGDGRADAMQGAEQVSRQNGEGHVGLGFAWFPRAAVLAGKQGVVAWEAAGKQAGECRWGAAG